MSVIEHCWRCGGTGEMDLDRGQTTHYVTCHYCKGTGEFQERRERARRSTDQGAVKERDEGHEFAVELVRQSEQGWRNRGIGATTRTAGGRCTPERHEMTETREPKPKPSPEEDPERRYQSPQDPSQPPSDPNVEPEPDGGDDDATPEKA